MFDINLNSSNPVYVEIANTIIKLIINGTFKEHDKLPSIRTLSQSLSINHNTVNRAYLELEHKGYVYSKPGMGMFVCENIDDLNKVENKRMIDEFKVKINELREVGVKKEDLIVIINEIY
ncbi:GntR family transcriptional regulator [Bacilli bacterium PM5-3]|nr:GntR family transcriptional regulator [Bacilli bacterium PM5-3]MDH6603618.1 GntR family transcriptional regulator [Bacilli bacterium PM5-9]